MRLAIGVLAVAVGALALAVVLLATQISHMEGRLSAQMNGLEMRLATDTAKLRDATDNALIEAALVQEQTGRIYEVARATGTMLMVHMKKAGTWPGELR